jgi:hypothetical protein
VEIKIGFFSPNSIYAQETLRGPNSNEKERMYQHQLITKTVMSAICRSFVETRIEDLDSILGMLFMQSDIPGRPLTVTKGTFINFIKNDLKVA